MTTDTEETKPPEDAGQPDNATGAPEQSGAAGSADSAAGSAAEGESVEVGSPEFQEMVNNGLGGNKSTDLNRFQGIKVTVSADLGRASVPIQTLMDLGEGSILELNREIDSPVELVAQGVPLASGEVVVVNGCFAIRVTQVYPGSTT